MSAWITTYAFIVWIVLLAGLLGALFVLGAWALSTTQLDRRESARVVLWLLTWTWPIAALWPAALVLGAVAVVRRLRRDAA